MRNGWLAIAWLALGAQGAGAVTPDELRELSGVSDREQEQRAGRLKTTDPTTLLPPARTPAAAPQSNKYGTAPGTGAAAPGTDRGDDHYAPPERPAGGRDNVIYSDSVPPPKTRFGIRLGTWFEANLDRSTSSAEPGMVELHVTSDVVGDRHTLRAGTLLYAEKALNGATKRLELRAIKGITPDGREFGMKGQVFDIAKVSGLNGVMQVDSNQIARHSAANAALAAVSAGARSITPVSALGAATRGAAETALTDTNRGTEFNTSVREVIYVSPQPLLVRVEELF